MLQRLVLLSGGIIALASIVLIMALPFAPAWRAAACVACLVASAAELVRLRRAGRSFWTARIAYDGSAALLDRDGEWHRARLEAGSVLLRRLGWLLLRSRDGRRFAALFRGRGCEDVDWRRLHVIWRHVGADR